MDWRQDPGTGGSYGAVIARQWDSVATDQVLALSGPDPATAFVHWKAFGNGASAVNLLAYPRRRWHLEAHRRQLPQGLHQLYIDGQLEATDYFAIDTMTDAPSGTMPLSLGASSGSSFALQPSTTSGSTAVPCRK